MAAGEIDYPGLKQITWHKMRRDLQSFIPDISQNELLMCPACCRLLPIDQFNVEHIIPQQSLADDPADVRELLPKNERTDIILLCKKQLVIKGVKFHGNGCNSWKGKYYDGYLRQVFKQKGLLSRATSRHSVALFNICSLGLFSRYGYSTILSASGLLIRRQFFSPTRFLADMPLKCQMILMGQSPSLKDDPSMMYWLPPFKFVIEDDFCVAIVRNVSMFLPTSHNPNVPIARHLSLVPTRYKFRPDFSTMFE